MKEKTYYREKCPLRFSLIILFTPIFFLMFLGCSDIYHINRGDHFFNQSNYKSAIEEYEKAVALTSDRKSPYYGLPTGEEAKKKVEISNLALLSKENFSKGNEEFWKGRFPEAAEYYREIDPQFLSEQDSPAYEKNRKEILSFLAAPPKEAAQPPMQEVVPSPSPIAPKTEEADSLIPQKPIEISVKSAHYYFPLQPGWKYYYRSSIPIGQKMIVQNLQEEVLPERNLNERKVFPVQKWQAGKISETLYYEAGDDQILLVAKQESLQPNPIILEFPIVEIKLPLEAGTSWTIQGKPRVIVGAEDVNVLEENYRNCIKIVEQSELVRTTRWYAPEIGLIKLQKTSFPGKPHESNIIVELTKLEKN